MPADARPPASTSALFTDLYELSMLQAYLEEGMRERAVFSLFVRRLPQERNYLLACGLASVLDYLEGLKFTGDDIAYLASLARFSRPVLEWLRGFRFTGDVWAVPEGTPVFSNEPILEVAAPIAEAQLVETFVLNQVHLQTVLASKAARVVTAAEGRPVVDFGARRMHGTDAALKAARAFHIAGVAATSNVLGGRAFGVPLAGTMAHSYIQSHATEAEAFEAFAKVFPDTTLLVDTYDTIDGVKRVIALAHKLGEAFKIKAVRLDSGDLRSLAFEARRLLDEAGLHAVRIFASGGLDEYAIADLVTAKAPIDAFGVGTKMGVSNDAPDLDIAYKLTEYAGEGRLKLSAGKAVLPGRKQVFRTMVGGEFSGDTVARSREELSGEPLLKPVMQSGKRLAAGREGIEEARERAGQALKSLPLRIRSIGKADPPYAVRVSEALARYGEEVKAAIMRRNRLGG